MYRNCILHSHRNVIRFNNGRRNQRGGGPRLFLGAQAAVVAYGSPGTNQRFDWHEETRDNGDKVVISTSSVFGIKRARSPLEAGAQDFGCFAMDTAAASR